MSSNLPKRCAWDCRCPECLEANAGNPRTPRDLDLTDAAVVARLVGLTVEDECTPDGLDWGYGVEPAEGAPVFLVPGWMADDGNCEVHYPDAESGREAAQEYVDGGDWGDRSATFWITVHAWQECRSVNAQGEMITGHYARDSHTIAVDPDEPACAEDHDHEWASDHEVVGGLRENPGVWANAGGVIIREHCLHCGRYRVTDTWAKNPEDGVQGLTSIRYEDADDRSLAAVASAAEEADV